MLVLLFACSCSKSGSKSNPFTIPTQNTIYKYSLDTSFNQDEEVFVIFTNKDAMTKISDRISIEGPSSSKNIMPNYSKNNLETKRDVISEKEAERLRITEEYFENNKERVLSKSFNDLKSNTKQSSEAVGNIKNFKAIKEYRYRTEDITVSAKLEKQVKSTSDNRTLNLWIQDGYIIESSKLDKLANSFLKEGNNNDIYEYITSIYGEEWYDDNTQVPSGLIGVNNTIDILIYEINDEINNPDGITLGFYWAKDNFLNGQNITNSNEKLMFYLEGEIIKADINTAISTLAHEFVHMVNFRQHTVKNNKIMDTWLNEMLAMISEDLLAKKLGVKGPA